MGNILSGGAATLTLATHDMSVLLMSLGFQAIWALISVYLLTVTMRILGLFYNSSKDKLGWFTR